MLQEKMESLVVDQKIKRIGVPRSSETKEKIRNSLIGIKRSSETKKKISAYRIGKKVSEETKLKMSLSHIGKSHPQLKETRKKLSVFNKGKRLGEKHPNWKNGLSKDSSGYLIVYAPEHPHHITGRYTYVHRMIMENFLGRILKASEMIHHINGVKTDNRIENLIICNGRKEHAMIHDKMEKFVFKLLNENNIFYDREKMDFFFTPIT